MNHRNAARSARGWWVGSLALLLAACGNDRGEQPTALGALSQNPDMSTMVAALQKANLVSMLEDPAQRLTVFAPDNGAFAQLFGELGITNGLEGMTAEQLRPILTYHLATATFDFDALQESAALTSPIDTMGGRVLLSRDGTLIRLDRRATVVIPDLQASNGVIHQIDRVILPSAADVIRTSPDFSSLASSLVVADTATPSPGFATTLDDDLAVLTVFAPNNAGFTALVNSLRGSDNGATTGISSLTSFRADQLVPVISYHVVPSRLLAGEVPTTVTSVDSLGGKLAVQRSGTIVAVDGIRVAASDLYLSNGVIHVLDRVLLPSITDMVTTSPQLSSLKSAVLAADFPAGTRPKVAATLDGTTPITYFAPSNAAFTAQGALPEGQALTNRLLYHGATEAAPLYGATLLGYTTPVQLDTALVGRPLTVFAEGQTARLSDSTATPASVILPNYFASNGVIHIIDRVLIPAP